MMKCFQIFILIFAATFVGYSQDSKQNTILTGRVIDQEGGVVSATKITLVNDKGDKFEGLTGEEGFYSIYVPAGTYSVEAQHLKHKAWELFKIERYEIALTDKMTFDIVLRINKEFTKKYGSPISGSPIKSNKSKKGNHKQ